MSYLSEVLADGPSGYWRLGETAGAVAADASGAGRDGAYVGSPALGAVGALGSDADLSCLFDGSNDYVTLPALPALGTTFTVEFWMRPTAIGALGNLFGDAGGMKVYFTTAGLVQFYYSGASHVSLQTLVTNAWYHVVISVDAGAATLYLNGGVDTTWAAVPAAWEPVRIGGTGAGSENFTGRLDEVALYVGTALSAVQVLAHYAAAHVGLLNLRFRLRRDLHDEDAANYRWTDAELNRHLLRALDEVSELAPDEVKTTLTTTPASRDVSFAALVPMVRIEAVEYPVDEFPPSYVRFSAWGTNLTMHVDGAPSAADDVYVYWGRRHAVEEKTSTLPAAVENTLMSGAGAYAMLEWADYAVNRANVGGPSAVVEYRVQGEQRLVDFRRSLRRFGRAGRVRSSSVYTPARPVESQTRDFGP